MHHMMNNTLRLLLVPITLAACSQTTAAQTVITVTPARVPSPHSAVITGMPCSNAPATVVIDGTEKPTIAGRDGNSFEVSTGTLGAGTHKVVLRCGDKNSADAILEVVPSPAIDAPRVVCAQNISPRDGAPSSEADSQAESSEQGARPTKPAKPSSANCDAKSIWTVRLEDTLAVRIAGYDEWATLKRENAAAPPA